MRSNIILILFSLVICLPCLSKEIYFGRNTELIYLKYAEETILKFPSNVKTISKINEFEIAPLDTQNPNYSALSVRPLLRKSKGVVSFILDDGKIVKLRFKTVLKEISSVTDQVFILKSKDELITSSKNVVAVSAMDLMKAMISGSEVIGYKTRKLVRTLWHLNRDLEAKLIKMYEGDHYNGYIFKLINKSSRKDIKIDLSSIKLGEPSQVILGQVDKNRISDKKSGGNITYLRLVAKSTSRYQDAKLPFDLVPEEK